MQSAQEKVFKWDPWPVGLIAFFMVAILSCAGFVAFCSFHPSELVTPDYYEQEMRYQTQIGRIENARDLERAASISYDTTARTITLSLPPPQAGKPTGTIQLYRPSAAGLDRRLQLALDQHGVQRIDARALTPGLWKVRVSWTVSNKEYYVDRPIVIPSPAA